MDVPLPERCQQVGVAVADDDTITGTILTEHEGKLAEVSRACQSPFESRYGCAIVVNAAASEYELWYVGSPEYRDHERCHALYEEGRHVK